MESLQLRRDPVFKRTSLKKDCRQMMLGPKAAMLMAHKKNNNNNLRIFCRHDSKLTFGGNNGTLLVVREDNRDREMMDCSQEDMSGLGVKLLGERRRNDCEESNETDSYHTQEEDYHPMIKPAYSTFQTNETMDCNASKKFKLLQHEKFMSRRSTATRKTKPVDIFSKLSDEMVLCIFSLLGHTTLAVVAQVCHRFYRLSKDESLWPRLDMGSRYLASDVLGYVLQRGTRVLRLASTKVSSPVFLETRQLLEDFICRLEYLDLSECNISTDDMELLLSKCRFLKKLSLESCELSTGVCSRVARNINLDTLNLCLCTNVPADGLTEILTNCKSLKSLNVAWTHLSRETMDALVRELTENIEQLNLSGSQNVLNDKDLIQLVSRCHELTELDVSDCLELSMAVVPHLVHNLPKLRGISISRCFRINIQQFLMEVCKMRRLERINAFRHISTDKVPMLEAATPKIRYNHELYSQIARPTVGIRRTSIWEMRCRE